DGVPAADITPNARAALRARKIGFVFQAFNLLPRLSVLRNVMLPLSYSHKRERDGEARAMEALEAVGLADRANHKPNQLSGGQRQRVAIARALVNHPKLILADEPTGNLDTKTAATIFELFEKLNAEGRTIIIVTHDAKLAGRCRRQLQVLDGRIVADTSGVKG
ncbi:MAG: ABC transporter ATP-binding protein, partial [Verrucomicrobiia bacterium]